MTLGHGSDSVAPWVLKREGFNFKSTNRPMLEMKSQPLSFNKTALPPPPEGVRVEDPSRKREREESTGSGASKGTPLVQPNRVSNARPPLLQLECFRRRREDQGSRCS